jgi:hypothetical protein
VVPAKVTFHPGASEDYAAAYCWYHDRGPTLAANFESEVDRGIRLISQNPSRWPKFDDQRRRFIVRNSLIQLSMSCMVRRRLFSPSLTANGVPTTGKNAAQLDGKLLERNVIAGTDCGAGDRVYPQIALAKLRPARGHGAREQEAVELNSNVPVWDS